MTVTDGRRKSVEPTAVMREASYMRVIAVIVNSTASDAADDGGQRVIQK